MADEANTCGICLQPLGILHGRTDTLCTGPGWHHSFHAACVNQWIAVQIGNGIQEFACPTCRRVIPPETVQNIPLDRWPSILVTLNLVNVVAFTLSREIVRLNSLMRGVGRAINNQMSFAPQEVYREHFFPLVPTLDRLWREDGESAVLLVNAHLFYSTLITAYVLYRLLTARRRMNAQEGGTPPAGTLCITIDGKEECVEIPDEMVGFITDIVMRMKKALPEVEALLKKTSKRVTRQNTRNRKRYTVTSRDRTKKRNIRNRVRNILAY